MELFFGRFSYEKIEESVQYGIIDMIGNFRTQLQLIVNLSQLSPHNLIIPQLNSAFMILTVLFPLVQV